MTTTKTNQRMSTPAVPNKQYRFVLTGGPGAGKTTLVEHLSSMGFATVREAARDIITEQVRLGSDVLPWKDTISFQRHVLALQLTREAEIDSEMAFLDRGTPDGLAYIRHYGHTPFPEILDSARDRYTVAFLLDLVDARNIDPLREESRATAARIHAFIRQVYSELGYGIIEVPVLPVPERAEFVIEAARRSTAGRRSP